MIRTAAARQLQGIRVRPDMQEEEARLFPQQMVMETGGLDAILEEGSDKRGDLVAQQDKVSGDSRLAALSWLEIEDGAEAHRGRNLELPLTDPPDSRDSDVIDSAVHPSLRAERPGRVTSPRTPGAWRRAGLNGSA